METEQDEEKRRTTLGKGRRTDDVAGTGQRIKTNEHGRVLCSLRRREIGAAVNLQDKSFTHFDHGKSPPPGEKSSLDIRDLKIRSWHAGKWTEITAERPKIR